jgi:uncharacterized peroxidase-related enzyme
MKKQSVELPSPVGFVYHPTTPNVRLVLRYLKLAFSDAETFIAPLERPDAFSAHHTGRTSQSRGQRDLRIRHPPLGFLPNYFQALAHDPQLLRDQVNLYTNAMFEERGLPKIVKEQIATVVSAINMSSYCLPAHLEILGRMGMEKPLARRLSIDYKSAPLDPKVMELLKFCEKLSTQPGDMRRDDIGKLRELGWNDTAIFDAVLVTSLYACANRFSAGLGLTPDFD